MSQAPPTGFQPCYRHPDQLTGIRCQRCGRPICAGCMTPATVGFQCPDCVRGHLRQARAWRPRNRSGGRISARLQGMPATYVIIALTVLVTLFTQFGGGAELVGYTTTAGTRLDLWRPFSYLLWASGLIGLIMNGLVMWIVGRVLEPQLGWWRYLAVFLLCGLGGAALMHLFVGDAPFLIPGGSMGALGLIAANSATKVAARQDLRPDVGLFVLLIVANLILNWSSRNWVGLIGAFLAAVAATLIITLAPRRHRLPVQVGGLIGLAVVCLAGVVGGPLLSF